jgi:hypothetical protein
MHRRSSFVALALLASTSLGCDIIAPGDCTSNVIKGLIVTVRNAQTGAPAGAGAVVTARDGGYVETLQGFDGLTFAGAEERSGTYDIAVSSPGYQPWTRQNVNVDDGSCHVKTANVLASIQPIGN